MRAAPRLALLCLALPRAILAADTADIDFLNLQGDIRIAKKERQNLERKVDAQNGDLARRLEAALADRQAIKTQLSMLQAQIHGLQAEVQSLAAAAAATSGGGGPGIGPIGPCLLYTSPSPRDLSTSRMPSSA